jgi:hypothetical protein
VLVKTDSFPLQAEAERAHRSGGVGNVEEARETVGGSAADRAVAGLDDGILHRPSLAETCENGAADGFARRQFGDAVSPRISLGKIRAVQDPDKHQALTN